MSSYGHSAITMAKISQFEKSPGLSAIELLERRGEISFGVLFHARGRNGKRELLAEALKYLLSVGVIEIVEKKTRTKPCSLVRLIGNQEEIDKAKQVFRYGKEYIKTMA